MKKMFRVTELSFHGQSSKGSKSQPSGIIRFQRQLQIESFKKKRKKQQNIFPILSITESAGVAFQLQSSPETGGHL